MSDRFKPISMEQLTEWVFAELKHKDSLFNVPRALFFQPREADRFRITQYGETLETPFGVAAGPHSQMAQNIIVAWLCGARFMELKTVQTLDELDVSKPCIDLEDEGYNVEWSQELKVHESFDEYLRAWILIHVLHRFLDFPGARPGMIFNMSVGYDLKGILQPNVQWYLDQMRDASAHMDAYLDIVAAYVPAARDMDIPTQLSNTITLSTMHGCPPDEIEKISAYLMTDRKLHTSVKCNPTLLGPERVREILNDDLGYEDVVVPNAAFEHDLKYPDAISMLHSLRDTAKKENLEFGVKLSNTLEVENFRRVFNEKEKMMYLSGRPLHAITVNLAGVLTEEFKGDLKISYSAGADAFNVASLLRCGMHTVTVCSDILKSGGYMRMLQYIENVNAAMDEVDAKDIPDFVCRTAIGNDAFVSDFARMLQDAVRTHLGLILKMSSCRELAQKLGNKPSDYREYRVWHYVRSWAAQVHIDEAVWNQLADEVVHVCARINLRYYADYTFTNRLLAKNTFMTTKSKTRRTLDLFDCIEAPCVDECPIDQKVPQYMAAVREGRFEDAVEITRQDNPVPTILGRVCDHLCENTCIRTHYDEPLAIREMKRFIMDKEATPRYRHKEPDRGVRVAIIGGGPTGLAAAYQLAQGGYSVTIFEAHPYAGGMVSGTIPSYRLPKYSIEQDMHIIEHLGIEIRYNQKAGVDITLSDLKQQGFKYTVVAVGAQKAKRLGCDGEDCDGVMDALYYLRRVREQKPVELGERIGVIGAGDTAMDAARSAWRLTQGAKISVIYRRTIDQMPADREEVRGLLEEGIKVYELALPSKVLSENGTLKALVCKRMKLGARGPDGRKVPEEVPFSEFEIPLDTMILAISQNALFDFFEDEIPELTSKGYIKVDPVTFETSVAGIYSGGDSAQEGPASIVKGCGDGKRIAAAIRRKEEQSSDVRERWPTFDRVDLIRRRARREFRHHIPHRPLHDRKNFEEVVLTMSKEDAQAEASRCLDCQNMCSICVGVCPNMAIMTYDIKPFEERLPELTVRNGAIESGHGATFRVDQPYQIAILTDFCNECGNCVTFCPTAGEPYKDKPRLYLNRDEFEAENDNAFMLFRENGIRRIEARFDGHTHQLTLDNHMLHYVSPEFTARIRREGFQVEDTQLTDENHDGDTLSLKPCAIMFILLENLTTSMPHIPVVDTTLPATRITA
jgi:NADPH-dependent glutamate synthase beta subunit-like oxidoreductase